MTEFEIIDIDDKRFFIKNNCALPLDPPRNYFNFNPKNISKDILKNIYLIRWDTKASNKEENWWHVVKNNIFELNDYSKNTRSKINRGIKKGITCEIEAINVNEMFDIYNEVSSNSIAYEKRMTKEEFTINCNKKPEGLVLWSIRREKKLIGYCECLEKNDYCQIFSIFVKKNENRNYASYVLFHKLNTHYFNEGFTSISDGSKNIGHPTNVHEFLISKFGFKKVMYRSNLYLNPKISFISKVLRKVPKLFFFQKLHVFQKLLKDSHIFDK